MINAQALSVAVILVVEDDPVLRLFAVELLSAAGFVVLDECNADDAITTFNIRQDITHLMTDIRMPGTMDGLALARLVYNRRPDVKIIVVSGEARSCLTDMPIGSRFLSKPYDANSLIAEIHSLTYTDAGDRRLAG